MDPNNLFLYPFPSPYFPPPFLVNPYGFPPPPPPPPGAHHNFALPPPMMFAPLPTEPRVDQAPLPMQPAHLQPGLPYPPSMLPALLSFNPPFTESGLMNYQIQRSTTRSTSPASSTSPLVSKLRKQTIGTPQKRKAKKEEDSTKNGLDLLATICAPDEQRPPRPSSSSFHQNLMKKNAAEQAVRENSFSRPLPARDGPHQEDLGLAGLQGGPRRDSLVSLYAASLLDTSRRGSIVSVQSSYDGMSRRGSMVEESLPQSRRPSDEEPSLNSLTSRLDVAPILHPASILPTTTDVPISDLDDSLTDFRNAADTDLSSQGKSTGSGHQKKRHVCPECLREFSCSSNLKRHSSVHTGIKPYTCGFCSMAFSNSSNRRKHERTHVRDQTNRALSGPTVPLSALTQVGSTNAFLTSPDPSFLLTTPDMPRLNAPENPFLGTLKTS